MKSIKKITTPLILILLSLSVELSAMSFFRIKADTIFKNFSVTQCDSLILANANNPAFVILDVSTPNEHNPTHIEGAINIDYYDLDFSDQINSLNKNKTYLIHCASGGRSGNTFTMMQTMGFREVYNMLGGMNAWSSASLPTTSAFAPLLMQVSDSIVIIDSINIGTVEAIEVTVTNRANDTLTFASVSSLAGTEFSSNFDIDTTLLGAEDYTFTIFYEPTDELIDSISFVIESNGGAAGFYLWRIGITPANIEKVSINDIKTYPNPANKMVYIDHDLNNKIIGYRIFDIAGQLVLEEKNNTPTTINVSLLQNGIYELQLQTTKGTCTKRIVIEK